MDFVFSDRIANLKANAIREIFKLLSDPEIISFAGGFPTKSTLPVDKVKSIANDILSSDRAFDILQYGATEGYKPYLDEAIKFLERYSIFNLKRENVLAMSGGQQGIDLACKTLLNKKDKVLVTGPTYLAALHIMKTYEAKVYSVKTSKEGIDIEDLEKKIMKHKPKFIYLVPTFSNPTGATYTVENRKAIAEITAKYNTVVLEDDPYSELRYSGKRVPSIKSFDKVGNVLYVTSFSKTISPGLRVAIAAGDSKLIRKMTIGKQAVDVHTSLLSQAIVCEYLKRGYMDEHLKEIIPVYREKQQAMFKAIDKYMPKEFKYIKSEGGLFIWGEFTKKSQVNADELFREAVKRKVAYVTGTSFFPNEGKGSNTIRLNFSNASLENIDKGIKILGDLFKEDIERRKK